MSEWESALTSEAERDLEKLDSSTRKRILEKLKWFKGNFNQVAPLPLSDKWKGFFKLRIGDWRVVYKLDFSNKRIVIHYVGNRDKIYK